MGTLPPIAVGGVGGSGTRVVSLLLREAGVFMGGDLNPAGDNLWFTLLFKHLPILDACDRRFDMLLQSFLAGMTAAPRPSEEALATIELLSREDRLQHPAGWLSERRATLLAAIESARPPRRWGWKEPNTHVVIERLWARLPELRYVHVVRHGLDIACSRNQNQLRFWGRHVLDREPAGTASDSLAYWCRVHRRMQRLLQDNPQRMYWLNYDRMCADPEPELAELAGFLALDTRRVLPLAPSVKRPPSRQDAWPIGEFQPEDVAYLRSLGYRADAPQHGPAA